MGPAKALRVVLDTNVVVSAIKRGTATRRIAEAWQRKAFQPLLSQAILQEYLRVLSYPRLRLAKVEIKQFVDEVLLPHVEIVEVKSRLSIIQDDPQDNRFLECALDGRADCLVTGDHHLLRLRRYRRITILSPAEFLDKLSSR